MLTTVCLLQTAQSVQVQPNYLSTEFITVITGSALAVIASIAAAAVKIIGAVNSSRQVVVAEQTASRNRATKRDRNIKQIHGLVNSRLAIALRLVVAAAKEKAERTNTPDDLVAYQKAIEALAAVDHEAPFEDPEEPWDGIDRRGGAYADHT